MNVSRFLTYVNTLVEINLARSSLVVVEGMYAGMVFIMFIACSLANRVLMVLVMAWGGGLVAIYKSIEASCLAYRAVLKSALTPLYAVVLLTTVGFKLSSFALSIQNAAMRWLNQLLS